MKNYGFNLETSPINIYDATIKENNHKNAKPFSCIAVYREDLLLKFFVPYFSSLQWFTKKVLDFKDWSIILIIKDSGKHLVPSNKELLLNLVSQMNKGRLSTNTSSSGGDRKSLDAELEVLLAEPSNYEILENGWKLDKFSGNTIKKKY